LARRKVRLNFWGALKKDTYYALAMLKTTKGPQLDAAAPPTI
jgi:hypothetical protein